MDPYKIRHAITSDSSSLSLINKEVLPISYSQIEYIFMVYNPYNLVLVIEESNGTIIGYLAGEFSGSNFHILSIGVVKEHRRKGLGSRLIKYLEGSVKNYCTTVSLNVHLGNKNGIRFYRDSGFKVKKVLKGYYNGVLKDAKTQDAYNMLKYLD